MMIAANVERVFNRTTATLTKRWTKSAQAYFGAFVIATLLCFSPSKLLAYFAPVMAVALFIVVTGKLKTLQRVVLVLGLWGLGIILYAIPTDRFSFASALIQLLTYSTFIVVISISHRYLRNRLLQNQIEFFISWVVLLQSAVGIAQAIYAFLQTGTFDSNTGDAVAGTISASLLPDGTLSNYMFAVNLAFILLFLIPTALLRRKKRFVIVLTSVTFLFASVLHVIIFLGISFVIALVLCRPPLPKGWTRIFVFVTVIGFVVTSATILSTNWSLLPRLVEGVTNGEYPRGRAYERVFGVMLDEYPLMPIVGLGPGQFSSRAAAMVSGYYLGGIDNPRGLPLMPTSTSKAFDTYLLDLWFQSKNSAGSTSQPFSSWLAIYTEFGGLAAISIIGVLSYHLITIARLAVRTRQRWQGTALCAAMLFLFLLGFQDVYWEVPQAILIGVMLIKVMHANMMTPLRTNLEPTHRLGKISQI